MSRRQGYQPSSANFFRLQIRDCEDWKKFGSWDNPWESVRLRDVVGHEVYDQIMCWNDSGAMEALQIAKERTKAVKRRVPCWLPKLKEDLYIGKVDWEAPGSAEACDIPESASEEENVKWTALSSQVLEAYPNMLVAGLPILPTGWGSSAIGQPSSGWEVREW